MADTPFPPPPPPPPPPPFAARGEMTEEKGSLKEKARIRQLKREKWHLSLAECRPSVDGFDTKEQCEAERSYLVALDGIRMILTNIDDKYKESLTKLENLPKQQENELKKLTRSLRGDQKPDDQLLRRIETTRLKYDNALASYSTHVGAVEEAWKQRIFNVLAGDREKTQRFYKAALGSASYEHLAEAFQQAIGKPLDLSAPLASSSVSAIPLLVVQKSEKEVAKKCFCLDCEWNEWIKGKEEEKEKTEKTDKEVEETPFYLSDGTRIFRLLSNNTPVISQTSPTGERILQEVLVLSTNEAQKRAEQRHQRELLALGLGNWRDWLNSIGGWLSTRVNSFLEERKPLAQLDPQSLRAKRLAYFTSR